MRIEERTPCPRCGHKRVIQRGKAVYVCFQCRHYWSIAPPEIQPRDVLAQFSPRERARLLTYRRAVRAGLYTDWPAAA